MAQDLHRVFNFSAGPCQLPIEVLQEAHDQLLSWKGSGMSVMEMSHRGKEFMSIYEQTMGDLREVIQVPQHYKILFMQGGATAQFAAVPLNLLPQGASADYAITGNWSQKAHEECLKYGKARVVCDTKASKYTCIPKTETWQVDAEAKYLHYCANETVYGVEFKETPQVSVPLVADMSSNFCSKPIEVEKHALIYAGVQKNLGPAGAAVVIVREDLLGKEQPICPTVFSYKTTAANDSMYNTPPCWTMYMCGLMAKHIKQRGGLAAFQEVSEQKARLIYDVIDSSEGYFSCPVEKASRSCMNVPFRVGFGDEALEKKFIKEASDRHKLLQLAGHRSVGGCRASLYNGMPVDGVDTLARFMKEFMEENPKEK